MPMYCRYESHVLSWNALISYGLWLLSNSCNISYSPSMNSNYPFSTSKLVNWNFYRNWFFYRTPLHPFDLNFQTSMMSYQCKIQASSSKSCINKGKIMMMIDSNMGGNKFNKHKQMWHIYHDFKSLNLIDRFNDKGYIIDHK